MGEVYATRQVGLERLVALKRLSESGSKRLHGAADFITEAVVTASLDHPNILPVHELGLDENGRPFYTMKRVKGLPWSERMPELSNQENLEILLKVCDAMAYAHNQGVLHRDIKPGNVMLGDYGEVLLMDWGLAAAVPEHEGSLAPKLPPKSAIGGTPAYLSPEMALGQGELINICSDVYLLGAILFEIVNGEPPHDGESTISCLKMPLPILLLMVVAGRWKTLRAPQWRPNQKIVTRTCGPSVPRYQITYNTVKACSW